MKEKLLAKGWEMYYECLQPCAKRYYTHKDKPGYEIRERFKSNTFSILLDNNIISGPHWCYMIEEKLIDNGI